MEHHATTVIVGETGSGKSTQIPQYLLEAGWCSGKPPLNLHITSSSGLGLGPMHVLQVYVPPR